jgi:hypothetical protein
MERRTLADLSGVIPRCHPRERAGEEFAALFRNSRPSAKLPVRLASFPGGFPALFPVRATQGICLKPLRQLH